MIDNNSDRVIVTESVIDAMSIMTIKLNESGKYDESTYFCLNSVQKWAALINYINENRNIKTVILSLDNDEAGRNATDIIRQNIHQRFKNITVMNNLPEIDGYDWNDMLNSESEDLDMEEDNLINF